MFKYTQNTTLHVPFKTITIKKSAYELIRRKKRAGESFTALFESTVGEHKTDVMQFAGLWKDMPEREFEGMKKRMSDWKRDFNTDAERRMRDVRARL